jgi:hypothetical protein
MSTLNKQDLDGTFSGSFFCTRVSSSSNSDSGSSVVLVPVLDGAPRGGDDDDDDDDEEDGGAASVGWEEREVGDDNDEGMGQRFLPRAITNTPRRPPCVFAECMCL